MWAVARVDLQITEDEFWRLSYRRYRALLDRLLKVRFRDDWRIGVLAAALWNRFRTRNTDRVYEPRDFFALPEERSREQTWQEQLSIVEMLNAAFGGRDLRGERG